MFEIGVNRINYWTFTCSIKLYKNKPSKVFPITKEEYESFETWKLNNSKVSNIMKRKQLNADRNIDIDYYYDVIKCDCGNSWVENVKHIPNHSQYRIRCPKCNLIITKFKH